jgi:hypothetical protein
MRAPLLLAVLLLALLLAACGQAGDSTGDFEGTQADVAQVVEDLQAAAQDEDPERICRTLLARSYVQQLEERGLACRDAVGAALDDADGFELEVRDVAVQGDRATARVASGTGEAAEQSTVRLVREGDNWRISALDVA